MKKYYNNYKAWKLGIIRKVAQAYADLIIRRLSNSRSDREFYSWMQQGVVHDANMIMKYDIYLD